MRLPIIQGVIRRRILVNFRIDREVAARQLPARFRPKLKEGYAVAGVCLIRLEQIRPRHMPAGLGLNSENAAHRIAVVWDDAEEPGVREGVFIPRRDSTSLVGQLAGGRLFPGEQHSARFTVDETGDEISLSMSSDDKEVAVRVAGRVATRLPSSSIFCSLDDASEFFEKGSLGYSLTSERGRLDGVNLHTKQWRVEPLELHTLYSSYFADRKRFPPGSVEFDHALIMRNIEHEWLGAPDIYTNEAQE
jgi:Uncharacterized conserved protein (COG2071)